MWRNPETSHRKSTKQPVFPVFNVYVSQDHLVPPAASNCLKQYIGSKDYAELAFAGGHIGIYVSSKAQQEIPTALAHWLRERDAVEL